MKKTYRGSIDTLFIVQSDAEQVSEKRIYVSESQAIRMLRLLLSKNIKAKIIKYIKEE